MAIVTAMMLALAGGLAVAAPARTALLFLAVGLVVGSLAAALGVLTARSSQGGLVGVLLVFVGLTTTMTVTREIAWLVVAERPDVAESLSWLVAVLAEGAWWVLVSTLLVTQIYGALERAPFRPPLEDLNRPFPAPPLWFRVVFEASFVVMLGLVLACAVSLAVRFRRSEGFSGDRSPGSPSVGSEWRCTRSSVPPRSSSGDTPPG